MGASVTITERVANGLDPRFEDLGSLLAKEDGVIGLTTEMLYGYGLYMAGRVWSYVTDLGQEYFDKHMADRVAKRDGLVDHMLKSGLAQSGPGGRVRVAGNERLSWLKKARENGKKGGRPRKPPGLEKNNRGSVVYSSVVDSSSTTNGRTRFRPPTLDELTEYVSANNLNVDCQQFLDFYESKGWKVGKSPMKSWKASARNWSRRQAKSSSSLPKDPYEDVSQ